MFGFDIIRSKEEEPPIALAKRPPNIAVAPVEIPTTTNPKGNTMNIFTLIPAIINAVKAVEVAATAPVLNADGTTTTPTYSGKEKFDAVIASLEAAYGSLVGIIPAVKALIDMFVAIYNMSGLFKKKS